MGKIKGKADQVKGRLRQAVGKVTRKRSTEAKGKAERIKGKIKEARLAKEGEQQTIAPFVAAQQQPVAEMPMDVVDFRHIRGQEHVKRAR